MRRGNAGRRALGISLLEASLALGVAAVGLGWFAQDQHRQAEEARADAAAARLAQVRSAAQDYVEARYDEILDRTVPGGPPVAIPAGRTAPGAAPPAAAGGLPSLQAAGHLPDAYIDRNAFGQAHALLVRQTDPGYLEGMVAAVGGREIPDAALGRIARKVGPLGGFVASAPLPGARAGAVSGTFGGWSADRERWRADGAAPEPGRPVALLDSSAGGVMSRLAEQVARKVEAQAAQAPVSASPAEQAGAAQLREASALLREANELLRRQAQERDNAACAVFALCER